MMSADRPCHQRIPPHFALLSPSDQLQYKELAVRLQDRSNRYNRNQRVTKFRDSMKSIRVFCVRNDENDWIRAAVCGAYWSCQNLCINPTLLSALFGKSKSSVNSALAELGCHTISSKESEILALLPFLDPNSTEWRQWSVREKLALDDADALSVPESEALINSDSQDPFFGSYHDCNCGCTCMGTDQFAGVPCRCALPEQSDEFGPPCNCGCSLARKEEDDSDE
jgi:hypothetical protein